MKTLLGIFCKHPISGKVKTRLGKDIGDEEAARLYEAFLTDIVDRMRQTADERVLYFAPDNPEAHQFFNRLSGGDYRVVPQKDGDLGDRLTVFFNNALDDCPRKVIVIGSDSPTITKSRIDKASRRLDERDAVLGRSIDGGYYLIALRKMTAGLFDNIDWSTSSVYDQQSQRLVDAGYDTISLTPIPEIDTIENLASLRGHPMLDQCAKTSHLLNELDLI